MLGKNIKKGKRKVEYLQEERGQNREMSSKRVK
jgi:hypothetical protein